jgi:anti-sigma B factor antagonist
MTPAPQGEHQGFRHLEDHGVLVVTFNGPKLSLETGEPLYRLVADGGHGKVVLNFENVRVLTSAPIGVLVNLGKKAGALGGAVRLCRVDPDILAILRVTRTDGLFGIFDDEQDAIAAFQPDSGGPEGR